MGYTAMNSGCKVDKPIDTIPLPTVKRAEFTRPGTVLGPRSLRVLLEAFYSD